MIFKAPVAGSSLPFPKCWWFWIGKVIVIHDSSHLAYNRNWTFLYPSGTLVVSVMPRKVLEHES